MTRCACVLQLRGSCAPAGSFLPDKMLCRAHERDSGLGCGPRFRNFLDRIGAPCQRRSAAGFGDTVTRGVPSVVPHPQIGEDARMGEKGEGDGTG